VSYLYVESNDHGRDHKKQIYQLLSDLHNKNIFMAAKKKAAKKTSKKKVAKKKSAKKTAKRKSAKRA
jgi:hypothetical protein